MTEAEVGAMCFGDRGRGHEPRNAGGLEKASKSKKTFSPRVSRRNQPGQHLDFRLLTSRNVRE